MSDNRGLQVQRSKEDACYVSLEDTNGNVYVQIGKLTGDSEVISINSTTTLETTNEVVNDNSIATKKYVDTQVNGASTSLADLQEKVQENTEKLYTHSDNISTLQTQQTTNTNNIATLTTQVNNNTQSINNLTTTTAQHTTDILNLNTQVQQNTNDITTLSNVGDLSSKITTLENNVLTNTNSITSLQAEVKNNTDNLALESSEIQSIKTTIENLQNESDFIEFFYTTNTNLNNILTELNNKYNFSKTLNVDYVKYFILAYGYSTTSDLYNVLPTILESQDGSTLTITYSGKTITSTNIPIFKWMIGLKVSKK